MNNNENQQEIENKVEKNNAILSMVLIFSVVVLVVVVLTNGVYLFKKKESIENPEKEIAWRIEKEEDLSCASVITKIYEDNDYIYNVADPCVATGTYVVFSNGERYTIEDAVNKGKVTIKDLEGAGIKIYKDAK